jgi:uncharacterized repeat protein (TIGR03803 family)
VLPKYLSVLGLLSVALCGPGIMHAQTLTTLYNFQGPPTDGSWPCAGVAQNAAGDLFGTTQFGGHSDYGVVFEFDRGGSETVVHSFVGGRDGEDPCAPLVQGPNGSLLGTTTFGGYAENGTVFEIRNDRFAGAYDFLGGADGAFPSGVDYANGALYGTTPQGGGGMCPGGCGTIFRLDRFGHETVLHTFQGPDGAYPSAGLIYDNLGNLYGTTEGGGNNHLCPPYGCGTVFKLDRSGGFTTLHNFVGGTNDGWFVVRGVVLDSDGDLFGTTSGGGRSNLGTIYEVSKTGQEKIIYSFAGPPDGATPNQLVLGPNGKMYGTTYTGGDLDCYGLSGGCGTIFEADKLGNERVLYRFGGITDGAQPTGAVLIDAQRNMYGTTQSGVKDGCAFSHGGCGTIWKLSPSAPPAP